MGKLVFWLIIFIAIIVLGRRVSAYLFNHAQAHAQAKHGVPVWVVEKQSREFMGQTRKQQTEMPAPKVNYYVTFRPLEDASEREFQVSQHIYEQLVPEQTGILTFKGSRFIAFEPDSTGSNKAASSDITGSDMAGSKKTSPDND